MLQLLAPKCQPKPCPIYTTNKVYQGFGYRALHLTNLYHECSNDRSVRALRFENNKIVYREFKKRAWTQSILQNTIDRMKQEAVGGFSACVIGKSACMYVDA